MGVDDLASEATPQIPDRAQAGAGCSRSDGRVRLKREIYEELGVLAKILDSENPPASPFVFSGASAHDRTPQLSKRA